MNYDVIVVFNLIISIFVLKDGLQGKLFSFFVFLKLNSGVQIVRKIEEKLNLTGTKKYYWAIFVLLAKGFILCHIVGTLYYFLSNVQKILLGYSETWVEALGIQDNLWIEKYVRSVKIGQDLVLMLGADGETVWE